MRVSVPTTTIYEQAGAFREDMAQWLERGSWSMSLPAMRFRIPLGAGCSCFPPLNLGTLFRGCVLKQGENKYLVGQRRQCVRNAPKWLQDCMLSVELKWHTNEQVQ